jgi:hypothetical protein
MKRKTVLAEEEDADFEQAAEQQQQARPAAKKGKAAKAGAKEFPFEASAMRWIDAEIALGMRLTT